VGNERLLGIEQVEWDCQLTRGTDLEVYRLHPQVFSREKIKKLGSLFGLSGEPENIPADFAEAPGIWIREPDQKNPRMKWRCVYWSQKSGEISYASGDDGYRYDGQTRRLGMHDVPDEKAAVRRAVELTQSLGVDTNRLAQGASGSLKHSFRLNTVRHRPRGATNIEEVIQSRTVLFRQKVAGGGIISIGGVGQFETTFISEGVVSSVSWNLPNLTPVKKLAVKTRTELEHDLRIGNNWTHCVARPKNVKVTGVDVRYPLVNPVVEGSLVYPYYMLTLRFGPSGEEKECDVFMPASSHN